LRDGAAASEQDESIVDEVNPSWTFNVTPDGPTSGFPILCDQSANTVCGVYNLLFASISE
jgi:hypothetical protein